MYHFDINKYKRTALKNKCIKIREHLTYNISNEMNVHRRKCFKVRTLQAKHDREATDIRGTFKLIGDCVTFMSIYKRLLINSQEFNQMFCKNIMISQVYVF